MNLATKMNVLLYCDRCEENPSILPPEILSPVLGNKIGIAVGGVHLIACFFSVNTFELSVSFQSDRGVEDW